MLKEEKKLLREIYQGTIKQMNQIKEFISCELDKYIENEILKNNNNSSIFNYL